MTTSIPHEQTKTAPTTATTKAGVVKSHDAAALKVKPARKAPHMKQTAPARRGTKTAKVLALLKRPGGVTLKDLMKVTGWQAHSVRGFLSGTLGKNLRTPVGSFKSDAGERTYRVSSK